MLCWTEAPDIPKDHTAEMPFTQQHGITSKKTGILRVKHNGTGTGVGFSSDILPWWTYKWMLVNHNYVHATCRYVFGLHFEATLPTRFKFPGMWCCVIRRTFLSVEDCIIIIRAKHMILWSHPVTQCCIPELIFNNTVVTMSDLSLSV